MNRRLIIVGVAGAAVLGTVVPSLAAPTQSLPVTVYHDSNKTAVGVRDIGVVIYNNGQICPVVSTQDWQCLP